MAEAIVINTGLPVALARAEALFILESLPLRFLCPQEVRTELDTGTDQGHVRVDAPSLKVLALESPLQPMARAALDLGEAAVIQLALEQDIRWVCIDDWKGRRAAMAVGLQVTGSLGLFIRAKRLGIIPTIHPYIKRAAGAGVWYDPELVRRVLESVGE